jgi:hypothetical protein
VFWQEFLLGLDIDVTPISIMNIGINHVDIDGGPTLCITYQVLAQSVLSILLAGGESA